MKDNQDLYETTITDMKWIAYDIPGNIGWIAYFAGLAFCFVKRPEFMQERVVAGLVYLSVIPALFMLVGILELISERISKLDRILPRTRLLRGFGALTLGGIIGTVLSAVGISYGVLTDHEGGTIYLLVMFLGAVLCVAFAGLLYKGYHKI